jgi:glucosamine-6-phosphate deaminase
MIVNETLSGKLRVREYETRTAMGQDAAQLVAEKIKSLLNKQKYVNMVFASAPSQIEFLSALVKDNEIDWSRIKGFHMDEYVGLETNDPQSFASFLRKNLFDLVPIHEVYFINGNAEDVQKECSRYSTLLIENLADIVCLGIGENTHIAFNDPHVADFNDSQFVKVVDLDSESRQQQVHDGCFITIDDVPTHALTLTIPALFNGKYLYCMVPGKNKAMAIYHTLNEEISPHYPSTVLRKHPNAILFIDHDSASIGISKFKA